MPSTSITFCRKVIPSPRLVGSLNCTSKTLLGSWTNICTTLQLSHQYVGDSVIKAAEGLFDDVPEDLQGHLEPLGWVQLVMGHHAWSEIVFGAPSLRLQPKGCSCTDDCHVRD